MDEIGIPYCAIVDFAGLKDGTFTLRDKESMQQERMP
jgi:glycyl-tRNA synthetase (class II)